ncbi:MAG TPA: iron ABC transporter permease [Steroidobacteraceae bacterium]|nr:iron ABC transporter permease [Steroidobacteraceae bacterium]
MSLKQQLLPTVLLLLLAFLALYPLMLLLLYSFQISSPGVDPVWSLQGWRDAFASPGIRQALWNTITIAIVTQSIAVVVGVALAWLLARTDIPGRNWLETGCWLAFFLPTLPVLLGWVLLMDPRFGVLNQLATSVPGVSAAPFNIFSWWGIVWAHLVTGAIAVKVVLLVPAFRNLDSSLEEASRSCGVSVAGTFRRIVLPLIMPAILVVSLMSLVVALQSFEIELTLGTRARIDVFSTMIYKFIRSEPGNIPAATALSTLIVAVMLPLVALQYRYIQRRRNATVSGRMRTSVTHLGRWRWPAFGLVVGFLVVSMVLPLALLVTGTFMKLFGVFELENPFTLRNWAAAVDDSLFLGALKDTVLLGFGNAAIAIGVLPLIAYIIVRTRYALRGALDFLSWLPWALPGIIMSLGILWMVLSMPILRPLHATIWVLLIAVAIGTLTVGVQMYKTTLSQVRVDMEEAARISGGSWAYAYRRVLLPVMTPAMVAVGVVAFVFAARDVSRIALLAGSETRPLALLQLDFIVNDQFEVSAVIGVIIVALTFGVALVSRVIGLRLGIMQSN